MKLKTKYIIAIIISMIWFAVALYFGLPWIADISSQLGAFFAWFAVIGISFIPGIAMSFVNASLLLDKRPIYDTNSNNTKHKLPDITILIAAHNEEKSIHYTLQSIIRQDYPSNIQIVVLNDASTDKTLNSVKKVISQQDWYKKINYYRYKDNIKLEIMNVTKNIGKANILTKGFDLALHDYIITLDADSFLHENALKNLMLSMIGKDENYAAVAGTVLCINPEKSLIAKIQEWDYLHGIAAVKRIQSMYKGTLVAQGAFSVYRKSDLDKVGKWPDKIGEDIVMTWSFHNCNYKVGYAENAICYTNVPETYREFYRQRRRWARGLIEALKNYPGLLFKRKLTTPFIWYNLFFPYIDIVFLFIFVPGVIAALLFKWYLLASIITIYLIPLAIAGNLIIYFIQKKELKKHNIKMPNNHWYSFILYMLFFQLIMVPATLSGYISEILKRKRVW